MNQSAQPSGMRHTHPFVNVLTVHTRLLNLVALSRGQMFYSIVHW